MTSSHCVPSLKPHYGDNERNEPVKDYDDESVMRLADQVTRGVSIATPVFDGANEGNIVEMLEAGRSSFIRSVDRL